MLHHRMQLPPGYRAVISNDGGDSFSMQSVQIMVDELPVALIVEGEKWTVAAADACRTLTINAKSDLGLRNMECQYARKYFLNKLDSSRWQVVEEQLSVCDPANGDWIENVIGVQIDRKLP